MKEKSSPQSMDTASTAYKVNLILDFVRPHLPTPTSSSPFILALSGVQGCGKSTLVAVLCAALSDQGYRTAILSVDDFYLTASDLRALRATQPENNLISTRGQPGTHDIPLANTTFAQLRSKDPQSVTLIPCYDKSLWNGMGDRKPIDSWTKQQGPPDIIIFEGWCVGFSPIPEADIAAKVEHIRCQQESQLRNSESCVKNDTATAILDHKLQHLYYLNDCLRLYCEGFMNPSSFDACIHLDAAELQNVYSWRLEQESALRLTSGSGMSDKYVETFGNYSLNF